MNCYHCSCCFDEITHIPRLLVLCGHSLCQLCCFKLYRNNRIDCPDCHSYTYIDQISLLPKNLALINFQNSKVYDHSCKKHNKKYQAFCQKDSDLLCIECILHDGHKNHQILSVEDASELKMKKIISAIETLQNLIEITQQHKECNSNCYNETMGNFLGYQNGLKKQFNDIRMIIDRQEQTLLDKTKQILKSLTIKFEERNQQYQTQISSNVAKVTLLNKYTELKDIQLLRKTIQSSDLITSITKEIKQPLKSGPFTLNKRTASQVTMKALEGQKSLKNSSVANTGSQPSCRKSGPDPKASRKPFNSSQNVGIPQKPMKKSYHKQAKQLAPVYCAAVNHTSGINKRSLQKYCYSKSQQSSSQKKQQNQNQLSQQLSAVDPKESLCHSFLSNMTSYFLSQKRSIYIIGGFSEDSNTVIKLNLKSSKWQQSVQLKENRSKLGVANIGKNIYIFGGKKGKERVCDGEMLNLSTEKWEKCPHLPSSRSGFGVVTMGDYIYIIGGSDGSILNSVDCLNTKTGEWSSKQSMLEYRDELGVALGFNQKIYAIGGIGGNSKKQNYTLNSAQQYDPKRNKWKHINSLNLARRALSATSLADGIYAIGGYDGKLYMSSVQKYDENENKWIQIASMNKARCTHSVISILQSQQIYVLGGFDNCPLDSVEKYSMVSNMWEIYTKMPTSRFMHSAILIQD